jgi:ribose transport system permease protein
MSTEVQSEQLESRGIVGSDFIPPLGPSRWERFRREASFRNVSALYILAAMFVVFSIWEPQTFLTVQTWKLLLDNQAISAIIAVAVVVPLSAGVIDLAVGTEVGIGAVLVAWLITDKTIPVPAAFVVTLMAGLAIGAVIAGLIVKARIGSFIATLAMSSILLAVTNWLAGSEPITVVSSGFHTVATGQLFGVVYPVYFAAGVSLIVWYLLEHTSFGRRVYATGANPEAARLAGVRTARMILGATVTCGVLSAFAGVLVASQLSTGDPTISPGYLLPAFAAAFLGSTQFKRGRFNVLGTLVAVAVLAIGVEGLELGGAPIWTPDLFNGIALLLAVGFAQAQKAPTLRTAAIRRTMRSLGVKGRADEAAPTPGTSRAEGEQGG